MSGMAVESLLSARIGLDPASLSPGTFERAVRARTSARGFESEADYARLLASDSGEWDALVETIIVPETWFFRDGGPFEALSVLVAAGGSPARPSGPLRVLSMPCATGEEAWSVAMVLASYGLVPPEASVDAVDLSRRALAVAARGVYGPASFRGAEASAWRPAFRAVPEGQEVDAALRRLVTWNAGNALEWGGATPAPTYDAIFCRNLLIYFRKEARARLLERLDALLLPGGLLVLGHAESPRSFFPGWDSVEIPRSFAARKPVSHPPPPAPPPPAADPRPAVFPGTGAGHVPSVGAAKAAPAESPGSELERARRLADRGELDPARQLCEKVLRLDPASARARFLFEVDGRLEEASHLRRRASRASGSA